MVVKDHPVSDFIVDAVKLVHVLYYKQSKWAALISTVWLVEFSSAVVTKSCRRL